MTTREIIEALQQIDPSGKANVGIYICRRYGGHQSEALTVRHFTPDGDVMIADERDDE